MENQVTKWEPIKQLPQTKQQAVSLLKTSPTQYWRSLKPKGYLDVFNGPNISLVDISNELGEEKMNALMVIWMNSFLNFYSVNGSMDMLQVADTINLITETYPHYTQEDFKLFFNMAKKGMFGQVYGRMDGSVIMDWMSKYDIHRDEAAQRESINDAQKFKTAFNERIPGCVYYTEYLKIKQQAENGDLEAINKLRKP